MSRLMGLLCAVVGLMLFQSTPVAKGQGDSLARRYITGTVVGVGGRFGGRTLPFRLIVNRDTSPEEVQRLNAALQSGGQEELLKVLSGMSAGRIQIGNNVGVEANAIISTPLEAGEVKVIVLYQRNVSFFEARYGTRSQDYKFGYAEIYLRSRGRSEGTFIPAAKVRLRDGNTWEVEDFGVYPARLMGLQVRTSGGAR
jgi:hypothetical protein